MCEGGGGGGARKLSICYAILLPGTTTFRLEARSLFTQILNIQSPHESRSWIESIEGLGKCFPDWLIIKKRTFITNHVLNKRRPHSFTLLLQFFCAMFWLAEFAH